MEAFIPREKGCLLDCFRLGTEPRHVHWCLLCLVTWHVVSISGYKALLILVL